MQLSPLEQKIHAIIAPPLESMGYVLVRVRMKDGSSRGTLEIIAERADGAGMGIDDCTEISHSVSALMDVNDPIRNAYDLEVSSPGLDRPLMSLDDFKRFKGQEAKVELMLPIDGRKRFRGTIESVQNDQITMKVDNQDVTLSFDGIRNAKLAISEAKTREALKKKKKA